MAFLVGVDEAGYGPNLGPFVMSLALVEVPDELLDADLWEVLQTALRRAKGPRDDRLVVDDSKAIFAPSVGLTALEGEILPFVWNHWEAECPLEAYWANVCLTNTQELAAEPWYTPGQVLPTCCPRSTWHEKRQRLDAAFSAVGVGRCVIRSVAIFPRRFNQLVAEADSKANVPITAVRELLRGARQLAATGDHHVHVDKLGGRNNYHAFLQDHFADGFVVVQRESARCSQYRVKTECGVTTIRFEPEFDSRSLPVALASMASKYLREVLMGQFNAFWQQHVRDLKPTAGYPSDSKRFYRDIAPARRRLGIGKEVLWRER